MIKTVAETNKILFLLKLRLFNSGKVSRDQLDGKKWSSSTSTKTAAHSVQWLLGLPKLLLHSKNQISVHIYIGLGLCSIHFKLFSTKIASMTPIR